VDTLQTIAIGGSRAMINTSPEPLSNWGASLGEDGLTLGGLWLAFAHPVVFLILLGVFLLLLIWLLPKLWRGIRSLFGGNVRGRSGRRRQRPVS
jgi:hypothetical protein